MTAENMPVEEKPKWQGKVRGYAGVMVAVILALALFMDVVIDNFFGEKKKTKSQTVENVPMPPPITNPSEIEFEKKIEERLKSNRFQAQESGESLQDASGMEKLKQRLGMGQTVEQDQGADVDQVEASFKEAERRRALEARKVSFSMKKEKMLSRKVLGSGRNSELPKQIEPRVKSLIAGLKENPEEVSEQTQPNLPDFSDFTRGDNKSYHDYVGKPVSEGAPLQGQKLLSMATVIDAVLDQDVVSDYVGRVRMRIAKDVYDITDSYILIPKGCKVIGTCLRISNINEPIQARMGLTANWAILPDGKRISFEKSNVLDRAGIHAIKDKVNRHFLAQFMGVMAYVALAGESSYEGSGANNDQTYEGEVGAVLRQQFANIASKYLSLVPTITLRSGTPIKIFLEDDLYVYPYKSVFDKFIRADR